MRERANVKYRRGSRQAQSGCRYVLASYSLLKQQQRFAYIFDDTGLSLSSYVMYSSLSFRRYYTEARCRGLRLYANVM